MYHGHRTGADGKEPNMTENLVLLSLHIHGSIDNQHEERSHGCNQTDDQTGRACGHKSHLLRAIPASDSICLVCTRGFWNNPSASEIACRRYYMAMSRNSSAYSTRKRWPPFTFDIIVERANNLASQFSLRRLASGFSSGKGSARWPWPQGDQRLVARFRFFGNNLDLT